MSSFNGVQLKNNFVMFLNAFAVTALVSCSNQPEDRIDVGAEESKGGFAVPQNLQPTALPATGQVKAYFAIDNNTRMPMQFDGSQAQITIPNLSSGTHTFRIEFEFEYTDTAIDPLPLATAQTQMALKSGTNQLDFNGAYDYPDSDGDSIQNYAELENGTDPLDSTCFFGQIWNGCTPAATPNPA